MANRIHAKGQYEQEEYKADHAGIVPGMLIERLPTTGEVQPHDVLGDIAEAMFAVEDALQGGVVSDTYADDSIVTCILPVKGAQVRARIQDGQSIAIGEKLMSGGDGTLITIASQGSGSAVSQWPIAVAMEAAAPSGSNDLALVRIL